MQSQNPIRKGYIELISNFEIPDVIQKLEENDKTLTTIAMSDDSLTKTSQTDIKKVLNSLLKNHTVEHLYLMGANSDTLEKVIQILRINSNIVKFTKIQGDTNKPLEEQIEKLIMQNKEIKNENNPVKKANLIGKKTNSFNSSSLSNIEGYWITKNSEKLKEKIQNKELPKEIEENIKKIGL